MGQSKQPESLRNLLRSAKTLGVNFGWIDVRIAPPFSLRKFLQIQVYSFHSILNELQTLDTNSAP